MGLGEKPVKIPLEFYADFVKKIVQNHLENLARFTTRNL